jgi:acetylornithine aminotransferase
MTAMQEMVQRGQAALIQNYGRLPVVMTRGQGCRLWDADGKEYLDLFAGFGAAILGHCHLSLIAAAREQADRLWHVGNQFYTQPQIEVAERLGRLAFPGQAFFCHGGADANESAVKLARLYGGQFSPKRWKIISLTKSFHGRTLAMISATGNPAVREGFDPEVPGFVRIAGGDFDALEQAVDEETAGVLMEPIQGEGGVNLYPDGYLQRVRQLCDAKKLALIFDEVWTGCGRTGRWFGHQHFQTRPDILTLGKAIGGGLPVGVMFARPELAALMKPGTHGSTLGGNPIAMAVSRTLLDEIEKRKLLENAVDLGRHAMTRLREDSAIRSKVAEVRGKGLFIGIELKEATDKLVERALNRGLNVNVTAKTVIRLAPPINISREDLDLGLDLLSATIAE